MTERDLARHALGACFGALLAIGASPAAWSGDSTDDVGATLYKAHCASCHGIYGRGDGPVAPSLKIEVPDLTRIAARHGGQFPAEQIRKIIDGQTTRPPHGPREMPVWGDVFQSAGGGDVQAQKRASDLVEHLTEYLRSIQAQ